MTGFNIACTWLYMYMHIYSYYKGWGYLTIMQNFH